MKIVIINKSGSINDIIEMMNNECLILKEDSDFIKDEIIKNGSGIYELNFGSRGEYEFEKNDVCYSKEDIIDEDNEDMLDEYYSDDCDDILENEYDFVKCVSYFEESWSVFVKVEV